MQEQLLTEGLLIVVELAAEWPSLATELPLSSRRVLAQDEQESPAAFAVRVGEQLNAFLARGISFSDAVIACNERLDEHAHGARAELLRTAASALAHARGGRLLLSASDRNEGRSRAAFAALVSELGNEWRSASVEAKLRFGDERSDVDLDGPKARAGARRPRAKDGARRVA